MGSLRRLARRLGPHDGSPSCSLAWFDRWLGFLLRNISSHSMVDYYCKAMEQQELGKMSVIRGVEWTRPIGSNYNTMECDI